MPHDQTAQPNMFQIVRNLTFLTLDNLAAAVRVLNPAGRAILITFDEPTDTFAFFMVQGIPGEMPGGANALTVLDPSDPPNTAEPAAETYEDEGSDRRAQGSVEGDSGTWWSSELIVSMADEKRALLTIQQHGENPTFHSHGECAELTVPVADLGALAVLIPAVIAQAKRDGVLTGEGPPQP